MAELPYPMRRHFHDMKPINITIPGVERDYCNLNATTSARPDCIKAKVLKELASGLSPILTSIFRKLLDTE